jgi:RNA polymerase sigma-70 factor, ECF subfamily
MQEPITELERHRTALTGHCYRMLGSAVDADDAVQETLIRAWRGYDRFEGRASLRAWLYTIATNVCLDALSDRSRRARPMEEGPAGSIDDVLVAKQRTHWLEPIADAAAVPSDADPAQRVILQQSVRLAFVAALQHLPPKQRAVLLLVEILGWSAAEVADGLETSTAAVNSALQRARATLASREVDLASAGNGELSEAQARLLDRYVAAFEAYDVDGLVALLREDASFSMPPFALWLRGPEPVRAWLLGRGAKCRGSRVLAAETAGGLPVFGQYRASPEGGHRPWALIVLELDGERIAGWNSFLDTEIWFPRFGLPPAL